MLGNELTNPIELLNEVSALHLFDSVSVTFSCLLHNSNM